MPRISLYRPEKGKDYKFIDRTIYEMFQVGGVDVNIHKYIGTVDGNIQKDQTQIQDLIFLENRDRKYAEEIYTLKGHYQTSDVDFNLSQFGLFLQNDTVFLTVHINNSVDVIGRKIMPGDVIEITNLREEYILEDPTNPYKYAAALKKFYVVEDINRAAEGYSATWYPHLYRIKLKPIVDTQEFRDILDRPEDNDAYAGEYDPTKTYYPGQLVKYLGDLYEVVTQVTGVAPPDMTYWQAYGGNSLKDVLSTYEKEMQINDAVIAEAELDAPLSGFETSHLYTLAVDPATGKAAVSTVDTDNNVATSIDVSDVSLPPVREGYTGYLLEDGIPPNADISGASSQFGFGIQFPKGAVSGDTFLRTDFLPNRLFRYDGVRWVKMEDNVRMTLSNTDTRQTQKTSFINNTEMSGINKIGTDVVVVDLIGGNRFTTGITTDMQVTTSSVYILTSIDYNSKYVVEAWLDESSKAPSITTSDANGKFAFTINSPVADQSRIRYSIFDTVVTQRQSLSKAIKFKPTADDL